MLLADFDARMRDEFKPRETASMDRAVNGIQVARSGRHVSRVAFAVDAALESIRRAAAWRADVLFVHHGIFWGAERPVTENLYQRMKALLDADMALYALHLPLDLHPRLGNNALIADAIGLVDRRPFGEYKGALIGVAGTLERPRKLAELSAELGFPGMLPFGPEVVASAGVVSGHAPELALQAAREGLDCYVTGEIGHELYHDCLERGLNVLHGGHYRTEVYGVRRLAAEAARDMGLETTFIDVATGM
jgi:dinuclear metal center YbgI/SA1388 family protein